MAADTIAIIKAYILYKHIYRLRLDLFCQDIGKGISMVNIAAFEE